MSTICLSNARSVATFFFIAGLVAGPGCSGVGAKRLSNSTNSGGGRSVELCSGSCRARPSATTDKLEKETIPDVRAWIREFRQKVEIMVECWEGPDLLFDADPQRHPFRLMLDGREAHVQGHPPISFPGSAYMFVSRSHEAEDGSRWSTGPDTVLRFDIANSSVAKDERKANVYFLLRSATLLEVSKARSYGEVNGILTDSAIRFTYSGMLTDRWSAMQQD